MQFMNWSNELTKRFKIAYPIIQAPMLGVTTPEMVAAVSNQGGLGSLPVGGLSPMDTLALIQKTKSLTTRPFAVNLFVNDVPPQSGSEIASMRRFLNELAAANGLAIELQDQQFQFYSYKEQVPLLLQEGVGIISFTFGMPDDASIRAFRNNGSVLIGTATCLREARLLQEQQVDYIAAQGIEAGGHRGTFVVDEPLPQIGMISLVSQIARYVPVPVIAAGGIHDGHTIKAVFSLGAAAAQIGSAFIASNESKAIDAYKDAVQKMTDTDAVLTRAFSGRWARGVRNKFMNAVDQADISIPPYPYQNSLTTPLRALAQKRNNKDFTNLWAGQSAGTCERLPAGEIFMKLVREAEGIG